ncbi:hypothetical protein PGT21_015679 [Puccinia graminis f. sp. tritici]|uniref:Uncharacterized protein n=1 Tax=Puccinia graminis f. sp. tritici TaxID=56615 RepID=A0A5B0MUW4_PUCGR|nr:hypothetical protein PGT21_015679 [Puccinia graminis f. sp. tritici]
MSVVRSVVAWQLIRVPGSYTIIIIKIDCNQLNSVQTALLKNNPRNPHQPTPSTQSRHL